MPVEVREIIFIATISQDKEVGTKTAAFGATGNPSLDIIKSCVEKVLEIIKEKNGR